MNRLVVIDDEQFVLDAIRRQLRAGQQGWDAHYFRSPQEALEFMGTNPTDVVLTDLNMGPMDGESFLQSVKERSPETVRLLLTGDGQVKTSLPAVLLAHQSFSKPCDPLELRRALERSFRARTLFKSDRLIGQAGALGSLPTVPEVYQELTRTANDPEAGLMDVAEIIERDAGISVKLLQLVNSSMFAVAQPITSVRDAVSYLGMNLVRMLVLSAEVYQRFDPSALPAGFSLEREQVHASSVASIARGLAGERELGERFFLAGLLHDVGRTALASTGVLESDLGAGTGSVHAAMGGYLLTLWGLPLEVVDAVAYHHEPSMAEPGHFGVVSAIHVADALAHELQGEEDDVRTRLDEGHLHTVGVHARLPEWRAMAEAALKGGAHRAA